MTNRRQWKLTVDFIYSDRPRGTDIGNSCCNHRTLSDFIRIN
ncbi:hypothetical protein SAMN06296273_0122 [Nitrosomonas ureae]|uniref:Uncharacterized protein n=1 Tax=Nitrosomonas ureae TaxID=44577 RepID=A0A285BUR6_9PROT|nr:hypothetical protein SAMN06296273_0122 [Nitrosomonas ureae]